MDAFIAYSIPIQGLKIGIHLYKYVLDQEFFGHFEESPVNESTIECSLQLDKRPDMLLLDFEIGGTVRVECDRCTAMIDLPIQYNRQLVVKYGESEGETEDEVVFISRDASEFNVAQYLYEFTVLALPITNTYDCQNDPNPPCNLEILKYLQANENESPPSNPTWDALKGFRE